MPPPSSNSNSRTFCYSKIMKGLRFSPNSEKTVSLPQFHGSWQKTGDFWGKNEPSFHFIMRQKQPELPVSISFLSSPTRVKRKDSNGCSVSSVLASQLRNLEFRNLNLLCWPITAPALLPQGLTISIFHGLFAIQTSLTKQSGIKWQWVPLLTGP